MKRNSKRKPSGCGGSLFFQPRPNAQKHGSGNGLGRSFWWARESSGGQDALCRVSRELKDVIGQLLAGRASFLVASLLFGLSLPPI